MAHLIDIVIPDLPEDPGDALSALGEVVEALVARVGAEGWSIEHDVSEDRVEVYGARGADGLRYVVGVSGTWGEEPPERWTVEAEVFAMPVLTRADRIIGTVVSGSCVALGFAAGGGTWWALSDHLMLALGAALPVGLAATIGSLVAALYLTPKSPAPPVPEAVVEALHTATREAVAELVVSGRLRS